MVLLTNAEYPPANSIDLIKATMSLMISFLGLILREKYFYLSFFLLKSRKGTKWTIMYILDRLLDPEMNWDIIFMLQSIP